MTVASAAFSPDEQALLDETADALVRRRMAVPAMMFLEVVAPMNMLSASMLHVLTPILSMALPAARLTAVAELLERRESIPALVRAIDAADARRKHDERAARAARTSPASAPHDDAPTSHPPTESRP